MAERKTLQGLSPCGFHALSYLEWGHADSARTIVCIHGLTRNAHDFDTLAQKLSTKARVIALDLVGRGQSDWLRDPSHYHQAQYLADINALLARLNVRQVDWIGTSLGGLLGIVLAAQPNTPIRRLVLNDAGPFVPLASLQRIAMYVGIDPIFASQTQVEAWYRQVYSLSGPFSDDDYIHLARHGSRQRPNGTFGLGYDPSISLNFNALATDINLWPLYQMITCPTMVIRGEISDVLPEPVAKLMTESGPRAVLHTIPHIGHVPGLCDAHQISLIEQFLGL